MKKLTDFNYGLSKWIESLREVMMQIKMFFFSLKDRTYFKSWRAKKEIEERDKMEQP
jgi:hypothetical protein